MKPATVRLPDLLALLLSIVLLSLLFVRILSHPNYIGDNCAMYLDCARMLLQGKTPYVDFIDLNPPMITYFSVLPVLISNALHAPLPPTFLLFVFALVVVSIATATFICLAHRTLFSKQTAPLILAFTLANTCLFFPFGERDHLFVLFFFPFFLMRFARWHEPSAEARKEPMLAQAIVGLGAALGICLKPQCGLLPLFLEAYWALSKRQWRPLLGMEMVACAVGGALYAAHFLFVPESFKESYFHHLLPLMASSYVAYNIPLPWAMRLYSYFGGMIPSMVPVSIICVLAFLLRKYCRLLTPLLIWTAAGYIIYVMQCKGWGYQAITVFTGYMLLAGLVVFQMSGLLFKLLAMVMENSRLESWSRMPAPSFIAFACLFLVVMPFLALDSAHTGKEFVDCSPWIETETKAGDPIMVLSSAVSPVYPALIQLNRTQGSRYIWDAPIVMLEYARRQARGEEALKAIDKEEERIVSGLEEDVIKLRPKLIMIEAYPPVGNQQLTLLNFANRHGLMKHFANYEPLGMCNRFAGWKLRQVEQ